MHAERRQILGQQEARGRPGADMMRLMTRRWACWTPASRCNYTRAGMVDSRAQAEVQAAADELVASRAEIGLQVAAIHEGRKRQVRLMAAAVGHPVIELQRIRFGPLTLGNLALGKWRYLALHEVHALHKAVGMKAK